MLGVQQLGIPIGVAGPSKNKMDFEGGDGNKRQQKVQTVSHRISRSDLEIMTWKSVEIIGCVSMADMI